MNAPLLIEIGCEEIPARMIPAAAADLARRLVAILEGAGLAHGRVRPWGGARRLVVRIDDVAPAEASRRESVLGPPVSVAFAPDGSPTAAGAGFARKQGIDPSALGRVETSKGAYAGFTRNVVGRSLGQLLAEALPGEVAAMSFPKTMRWADGSWRWVRPVHWLVALHGDRVLPVTLFGVEAGRASRGHRFLATGPVEIPHADGYADALRAAFVVADPNERRRLLRERLDSEARAAGGELVDDPDLLEEAVDLVEWPGVVVGRFDEAFLSLPAEVLVTTLRHHQKAFSVQGRGGLLPVFLSVANTDRDPAGHVRRGNEWVVSGRLEDARFFWNQDRSAPLASRLPDLARVLFHVKIGSYADKSASSQRLASRLADRIGLGATDRDRAVEGSRLAKADLVTGLVGEFPELQGVVGGLLLRAEGADPDLARAVYDHYKPAGAEDALPASEVGCVVSVADKLDTVAGLYRIGETPTGSRDPFGLRRALNGAFRIAIERRWPVSLRQLAVLADGAGPFLLGLRERLENVLRDRGFTANEIQSVLRAGEGEAALDWPLHQIVTRLEAIAAIRERSDFAHLVDLTKRVANIRRKNPDLVTAAEGADVAARDGGDPEAAVSALAALLEATEVAVVRKAEAGDYRGVVDDLAGLVGPVDHFFDRALVVNPDDPATTYRRLRILGKLEAALTRHFDLRELPGQADRRT